ncbi:MAG TPA: NAD(P)-dependent oxidoreductase [Baekduia sp.]|nr:NAD(P)-dependent oxidoreductase [Baekduia sp.]HMJ34219.1 NAD(P)-dependent oxidoreductase [Baekduia sp.]
MRILVTGSSGHLGEALMRVLSADGCDVVGLDVLDGAFTTEVGSIADRAFVGRCLEGVDAVLHAATLHKPHVGSHSRQEFVDTNVTGTLNLLEEAVEAGVGRFVFTSTTSAFGRALTPGEGAPAAWITEDVVPVPRNVYGVTKTSAEGFCELVHRDHGLPCLILRTSRFFPEADDRDEVRTAYEDANLKTNELLYRRVDLEDAVSAHRLALERAPALGFGRYIISATTPFTREDLGELRADAPAVVARRFPDHVEAYERLGWRMFPSVERVYDNARARADLGWAPRYDFRYALDRLERGEDPRSELAGRGGRQGLPPGQHGPVHRAVRGRRRGLSAGLAQVRGAAPGCAPSTRCGRPASAPPCVHDLLQHDHPAARDGRRRRRSAHALPARLRPPAAAPGAAGRRRRALRRGRVAERRPRRRRPVHRLRRGRRAPAVPPLGAAALARPRPPPHQPDPAAAPARGVDGPQRSRSGVLGPRRYGPSSPAGTTATPSARR